MKFGERVKNMIKSWLDIQPANPQVFRIDETTDFNTECIKNRIWYRGDSHELSSFYSQLGYAEDTFWGITQSADIRIKRSHTGLPKLLVQTIINTVVTDYSGDNGPAEEWKNAKIENNYDELLKEILSGLLIIGDGALKLNYDESISKNVLFEWVDGDNIDFVYERGKLIETIFISYFDANKKTYRLEEHYGYGYVKYKLYDQDKEVPLKTIEKLANLQNIDFDKSFMMAVPVFRNKSIKYKGRGESIFTGKYDSFDSLDEIVSQWLEAVRTGRAIKYIPQNLIPRDETTGEMMTSNPFDNSFIKVEGSMQEDSKNEIVIKQPEIPSDNYLQSYVTFLDLCLQGLVSPSTLGIDNKKLDNAEAQREKEKTTLYTRGAIIDIISDFNNKVYKTVLQTYAALKKEPLPTNIADISSKFGEYNNPSFEAQIETIGKGKTNGILSLEASVEELYGDSKDDDWKKEEVARLKAEQGIIDMEEPAVNLDNNNINEVINE